MKSTPRSRRPTRAALTGWFCLTIALALLPSLSAEPGSFQVNDRVQTNANGLGWIKGTVIEIGSGSQNGKVKIHADGYPDDFWVRATMSSAIRKLAGESPAAEKSARGNAALDQAEATTAPRPGKYLVMSFGAGSNPLHLGYVELTAGGSYKYLNMGGTTTGQGKYVYDGGTATVRWISGPVFENKWGGKFDITREGRTHSIRFTRTTLCTNSMD
jgi:hypothetical protein